MLPAKGSLVSGNGQPRNEVSVFVLMAKRCKCIRSGTTDIETVCGDQAYERAAAVLLVMSECVSPCDAHFSNRCSHMQHGQ